MNNEMTFPIRRSTRSLLENKGFGTLLGILLVFVPFVLVGFVGESLGAGSAISNVVITLAYVLGLAIATLVLRQWGWNWRGIGLARPASWRRTALLAVGATLAIFAALVASQVMAQVILGVDRHEPLSRGVQNPPPESCLSTPRILCLGHGKSACKGA